MSMVNTPARIAVPVGDPNGIGPEIALRTAVHYADRADVQLTVFGPSAALARAAQGLGWHDLPAGLRVVETPLTAPCTPGVVSAEAGHAMIAAATDAIEATRRGEFDAVVAGPHHERAVHLAGIAFSGYPSLLARVCGQSPDEVFMMLIGGDLRIVHVTLHESVQTALHRLSPELVTQAVLMATRGRPDRMREIGAVAERAMIDSGVKLPVEYEARNRMLENFSPKTLCDDRAASDWFDMFTMWPIKATPGLHAQTNVAPTENRLAAYRGVTAPTMVIGFADDVVVPAYLGAEVAQAIPNATYLEIPDTGHLGFIEKPDAVNDAILQFFASECV